MNHKMNKIMQKVDFTYMPNNILFFIVPHTNSLNANFQILTFLYLFSITHIFRVKRKLSTK